MLVLHSLASHLIGHSYKLSTNEILSLNVFTYLLKQSCLLFVFAIKRIYISHSNNDWPTQSLLQGEG